MELNGGISSFGSRELSRSWNLMEKISSSVPKFCRKIGTKQGDYRFQFHSKDDKLELKEDISVFSSMGR
jgi:hypothetical protein